MGRLGLLQSTPLGIIATLNAQGFRVDHIKGDAVDLNFMASFEEKRYGAVFIRTHGGTQWVGSDAKLHIMVRPFFDSWPPDSGYAGVGVFYVGTNWGDKYAYAFNDQFVSTYMGGSQFPNTLMHLLVCFGAATEAQNDMIPAFLKSRARLLQRMDAHSQLYLWRSGGCDVLPAAGERGYCGTGYSPHRGHRAARRIPTRAPS